MPRRPNCWESPSRRPNEVFYDALCNPVEQVCREKSNIDRRLRGSVPIAAHNDNRAPVTDTLDPPFELNDRKDGRIETSSREGTHGMVQSWIIAGSIKRLRDALGNHRVFPSPSKIPYGGFSPVRLQTRSPPRPSPGETPTYTWRQCARGCPMVLADKHLAMYGHPSPHALVQRPLASRPVMLSGQIIAYYGLIRATRGHRPAYAFIHSALPAASGSPI